MVHRKYRTSLDQVEDAFRACWKTAQEHVAASKVLKESDLHAQALSLAVLAIEELGKLFCVDGLLFARADDGKAKAFAKAQRDHRIKLSSFELIPALLSGIASTDSRTGESRFAKTMHESAVDLKARGNVVLSLLGGEGFHGLDEWKQKGFYSQLISNSFRTPSESVGPEQADAVYMLAWRASSTLDFLLKNGHLERYIDAARDLRSKLSEELHKSISATADEMIAVLFNAPEAIVDGNDPAVH